MTSTVQGKVTLIQKKKDFECLRNVSMWERIFRMFTCYITPNIERINELNNIINEKLSVDFIIKLGNEFRKIKYLLLDDNQRLIFKYLDMPFRDTRYEMDNFLDIIEELKQNENSSPLDAKLLYFLDKRLLI